MYSGESMKLSKITGLILTLGTFVVWFAAIFGVVKGDTALIFGVGLLALWKGEELLELRDR